MTDLLDIASWPDRVEALVDRIGSPLREGRVVAECDSTQDLARAMGIDCVLIAGGHQSASRLQGNGVPVIAGRRELFHPVAEEPLRTEQTE